MGKPKLVDTWYYDVKDLEITEEANKQPLDPDDPDYEKTITRKRLITKKVEIAVHMDKDTVDDGGSPYMIKTIKFVVSCKEPKFKLEGTDIEALRDAAFDHLGEHFKVKWVDYYLVTVAHSHEYGGGFSTGLTFTYKDVRKGISPSGRELLRQYAWRGEVEIKPWPGEFTDKQGRAIACILATPANKSALEEFANRINLLRDKIKETIRPERIMETLQNMNDLARLLPPIEEGATATIGDE